MAALIEGMEPDEVDYTSGMPGPKITQIRSRPGTIDLGLGDPDFNLLPVKLLHSSAETYFKTSDPRPLQYGLEQGNGAFRQALAGFISAQYGYQVDPEWLFITPGASSGLDLLCTLFTQAGDVIFVEEPTYFLALRIFRDHGLRIVAVPMDAGGMEVGALEQLLTKLRPKFVYTVPVFQNPSGRTLSYSRRSRLVDLAQEHNFLVIADEAYQFLYYGEEQPASFSEFTPEVPQILSLNSFSKILAPGLRLGWIQADEVVISRLAGCGLLDSGGGMSPFTSAIVRDLVVSGGLDHNINQLQLEYARRLEAMNEALHRHLPQAEYQLPAGGFFFWVRLPGVNTADLRSRANKYQVDFRQGTLFSSQDGLQEYIRLAYCFYESEALEEGIVRLKQCLEA